jgi:hypothetical protein
MTGATITAYDFSPPGIGAVSQYGYKLIYFTVTLDGSAKASFADYRAVKWIDAHDVGDLSAEAATAYTAAGDITFTNASNAIAGLALVQL